MLNSLLDMYKPKVVKIVNTKNLGENLLNIFPIYVINLSKDKTRRNYIKYLFQKHKINYNLVIVDQFKYTQETINVLNNTIHSSKRGCILSHLCNRWNRCYNR